MSAFQFHRLFDAFRDPLFRSPAFLKLIANGGVNGVSVGADYVLVGWFALQAAESTLWVGGGFALYHLPGLLLGVPAGSLADRFNRRRMIRQLELAGVAILLLFAGLINAGHFDLMITYLLTVGLGALRAIHHPTRLAYTYDVAGAERVIPAISALNFTSHVGYIVGAAVVGITAEYLGAQYALLTMALAHLLAWLSLRGDLPAGGARGADPAPIAKNLADYAREIVRNRLLAALVVVTAGIEIFGTSLYTTLPQLAEDRLGLGADGLGVLVAISQVGGLLAAFVLFVFPQSRDPRGVWLLSIIGLGVAVAALGYTPSFVTCALALGAAAGMIAAWDILTQSMMQLSVADHLRGRAMGAWMFAIGSAPLGHLQMGVVVAMMGLDLALYFNGAMVLVVIAAALWIMPGLRPS